MPGSNILFMFEQLPHNSVQGSIFRTSSISADHKVRVKGENMERIYLLNHFQDIIIMHVCRAYSVLTMILFGTSSQILCAVDDLCCQNNLEIFELCCTALHINNSCLSSNTLLPQKNHDLDINSLIKPWDHDH